MEDITQNLKEMIKARKNQKLIYKQSNERSIKLFVDDLSEK
jgi:hypothetical protein